MKLFAVCAAFLPLMAACTTTGPSYQAPSVYEDPSGETATLRMKIDPEYRYGFALSQDFYISTSEREEDQKKIAPYLSRNFLFQTNHTEVIKKIPTETRIYLKAHSYYEYGTQYSSSTVACATSVSFVPKQGEEYVVIHEYPKRGQSCRLSLIATSTGKPPESAQLYVVTRDR